MRAGTNNSKKNKSQLVSLTGFLLCWHRVGSSSEDESNYFFNLAFASMLKLCVKFVWCNLRQHQCSVYKRGPSSFPLRPEHTSIPPGLLGAYKRCKIFLFNYLGRDYTKIQNIWFIWLWRPVNPQTRWKPRLRFGLPNEILKKQGR